jgi:hypothetical protein
MLRCVAIGTPYPTIKFYIINENGIDIEQTGGIDRYSVFYVAEDGKAHAAISLYDGNSDDYDLTNQTMICRATNAESSDEDSIRIEGYDHLDYP